MRPSRAVLLLLGGIACSGVPQDRIVHVASGDSAMGAAIRQSQRTVDEFIEALRATPAPAMPAVKLPLRQGALVEFVWISAPSFSDGWFHGTIDNDIETLSNYHAGDSVRVHRDSIADWMYVADGELRGGYSIRLLAPQMAATEMANLPFRMPPDSAWAP